MNFISSIHIHELYHLKGLEIEFDPKKTPHLLLTGRNGSGKTVLLRALRDFLHNCSQSAIGSKAEYERRIQVWESKVIKASNPKEQHEANKERLYWQEKAKKLYGKIELGIDTLSIHQTYQDGKFLIAYYEARRTPSIKELKNPTKPEIKAKASIEENYTREFLNFLSDLKIQGALAQNEGQEDDANHIKEWFENFKEILRRIFQDDKLELEFDYRNYAFHIVSEGKRFKFTELSDGFAAILDIVADLILKMQREGESVSQSFLKEGIVLIDEVETHLHLSLQKEVMPFLTTLFPNVQFIVTTHSPFVLNSLDNAVAYDLEHREVVSELNEYSAESITAGYFGVPSAPSYAEMLLVRLDELLAREKELPEHELTELQGIQEQFENLSVLVAPALKRRYLVLLDKYNK